MTTKKMAAHPITSGSAPVTSTPDYTPAGGPEQDWQGYAEGDESYWLHYPDGSVTEIDAEDVHLLDRSEMAMLGIQLVFGEVRS